MRYYIHNENQAQLASTEKNRPQQPNIKISEIEWYRIKINADFKKIVTLSLLAEVALPMLPSYLISESNNTALALIPPLMGTDFAVKHRD